mmetsp:Transcript_11238/g.45338  ORF Transcript_11238/g.45338 Transcript_11238/m.45338 type:complete len:212 (-) Transcript_11238:642-1277(-)
MARARQVYDPPRLRFAQDPDQVSARIHLERRGIVRVHPGPPLAHVRLDGEPDGRRVPHHAPPYPLAPSITLRDVLEQSGEVPDDAHHVPEQHPGFVQPRRRRVGAKDEHQAERGSRQRVRRGRDAHGSGEGGEHGDRVGELDPAGDPGDALHDGDAAGRLQRGLPEGLHHGHEGPVPEAPKRRPRGDEQHGLDDSVEHGALGDGGEVSPVA